MAFSIITLVSATGDRATARPIVVAATTDIPATTAAPKINCALRRAMIASIMNAIAVAYALMTPWHVMSFTYVDGVTTAL
jgi:hypothetical protein